LEETMKLVHDVRRMKMNACKYISTCMALLVAGLPLRASVVKLDVALTDPLVEAGAPRRVVLKVGLEAPERVVVTDRAPVNMALVIDKSGSMQGERIRQARLAAAAVLDRLRDDDIISIVAFDSGVQVIVPATRASSREEIRRGIEQIGAGGSTALFAGVSKGAAELRKFIDQEMVNRVILLSDGKANVGPQSPGALGDLGASLMKDGVSVSTIGLGLGYNEDLMVRLSRESDGNHSFVEEPDDLVAIFDREFGEAMSVIAQDVEIRIDCGEGIRPLRTLGRPSEISGNTVISKMNQLYGGQQRHLLLEVEVPAQKPEALIDLASVTATFRDLDTDEKLALRDAAQVRVTASKEEAERQQDKAVISEVALQQAVELNDKAVQLRDEGRVEEAKQILLGNTERLNTIAQDEALPSESRSKLQAYAEQNAFDAEAVEEEDWGRQRKQMRETQYQIETQRYESE
jgi:Ca-activated chloride channel family protein